MASDRLTDVVEAVVDRLDNVTASLSLPMPDRIHVQALRSLLPEIANDLRAALAADRGTAPEADVPPPGLRCLSCEVLPATRYARDAEGFGFALCGDCRMEEEVPAAPASERKGDDRG